VQAALCEFWPPALADTPAKDREITDNEVYAFLNDMSPEEKRYCGRRFKANFMKNADAAMRRLFPPPAPAKSTSGAANSTASQGVGE
jgi:hypothetical protein